MSTKPRNPERRAAYCRAFTAGETIPEIACRFNATRQAVYNHLKLAGLVGPTRQLGEPVEIPEAQFVDRDPCPRCAVRRDVGCHHSRAPLGMGAFA